MAVEIEIGPLLFKVGRESLVVCPRRRGGSGFLAKHLTLHFRPRGLKYGPHVTDPRTGWRRFLGRFSPDAAGRVVAAILQDVMAAWLAATWPVDLATMEDAGWVVLLPNDEAVLEWARSIRNSGGRYVVTEAAFKRFLPNDEAVGQWARISNNVTEPALKRLFGDIVDRVVLPRALDALPPDSTQRRAAGLVALHHLGGDRIEWFHLSDSQSGLNLPPGWYGTRHDWLGDEQQVMLEIFARHLPPRFWRAFANALRLLGLPPDAERLNEILKRSEASGSE